ncbi:MAG: hypothetical protein ABSG17_03655 [Spirochaetia bacterium]
MQGLPRRFVLTSIVYVGAVLLLLCLAIFAGSFTQTMGDARISGRYSPFPLFNRSRLEALTLSWNGLDLSFSRTSDPALVRLDSSQDSADILLTGDERLHLSLTGNRGSALTISPVQPWPATASVITIPFKVSGVLEGREDGNRLSWRQGGRAFQLLLPQDARVDYYSREIAVKLGGSAGISEMSFVALSPAPFQATPASSRVASRLPDEKSLVTQEQMAASLARFADSAYAGWTLSRYSLNDGTWRMADGRQGFSEDIGTALLAEAVARGTFKDMVRTWSHALDDQLSANPGLPLAYSTCVYTGMVRDFARQLRAGEGADTARLKALVAQADPSLLARPGVMVSLLDKGGPTLAKSALVSLSGLDPARLPTPALLNLLEALEDYAQLLGDDAGVAQVAGDLIDKRLMPFLVATSEGSVFLGSKGGASVDVKLSIRCGSLLVRAGSLFQRRASGAFGRSLIASSLSLAADDGFLPASLTLASGHIASRDGVLAPESAYPFLPLARHLPREIPLYRLMGSGCWVWTAADLVSADQTDGDVKLVFSYPAGVPHHLVFRGVRPFSQIRLHGIPWHSDPSYVAYSDGWSYDDATRTLTMKITGRKDTEEVDFTF